MITDTLEQIQRYASLSPRFGAAFEFLKSLPADKPNGRYDIDGDHCFALVQSYLTKPHSQAAFEAHKKYLDIQFIQSGRETIFWSPLAALTTITTPYGADLDAAFFAMPSQVTPVNLRAGEFTIFFPTDGHAPGLEFDGSTKVRKIVIKVCV